jgi:hypothetical protein
LPLSDLAPDRVLAAEVRIFLVQHLALIDGLRSAVEPDRAGGENLDLLPASSIASSRLLFVGVAGACSRKCVSLATRIFKRAHPDLTDPTIPQQRMAVRGIDGGLN